MANLTAAMMMMRVLGRRRQRWESKSQASFSFFFPLLVMRECAECKRETRRSVG